MRCLKADLSAGMKGRGTKQFKNVLRGRSKLLVLWFKEANMRLGYG